MGGWDRLNAHLGSLALLMQLLELLCSQEAHWLVPGNQLSPSWHGGEDDVSTQSADVCPKVAFDDGRSHHTFAFHGLADDREGHCDSGRKLPCLCGGYNSGAHWNLPHGASSCSNSYGSPGCSRHDSDSLGYRSSDGRQGHG